MKISYLVSLRNELGEIKFATKHQVWGWNEQNSYLIPGKLQPNDPSEMTVKSPEYSSMTQDDDQKISHILSQTLILYF